GLTASGPQEACARRSRHGGVANFADIDEAVARPDVKRLPRLAEDAQVATGIDCPRCHPCLAQAFDGAVDRKSLGNTVQRVVADDAIEKTIGREPDLFGPV